MTWGALLEKTAKNKDAPIRGAPASSIPELLRHNPNKHIGNKDTPMPVVSLYLLVFSCVAVLFYHGGGNFARDTGKILKIAWGNEREPPLWLRGGGRLCGEVEGCPHYYNKDMFRHARRKGRRRAATSPTARAALGRRMVRAGQHDVIYMAGLVLCTGTPSVTS